MTGGLGEAAVESSRTAPARDLHVRAVKRETPGLIDIEPIVQHPANEASGLAYAKDQNFARRRCAFKWVIAEIRQQIANSGEPRTCDIGILRGVNEFVECARLEAVI